MGSGPQTGDANHLNPIVSGAMPETLALVGLILATILYTLLVRRRAVIRAGVLSLSRALTASNEIALGRLRTSFRGHRRDAPMPMSGPDGAPFEERRSGGDRRSANERWRGRGRRDGGDRRRNDASS
jgi:hypothetical protein